MDRLVGDVLIYWSRAMRTMAILSLVPLSFAKRLTCNDMLLDSWYCENIDKKVLEPDELSNILQPEI